MNPSFPDWTVAPPQTQLPLLSHKNNKPNNFNLGLDGELVELIWENGQVVLHTQTHRHPKPGHEEQHTNTRQLVNKHVHNPSPSAVSPPRGSVLSCENPVNNLVQDAAETVSWLDCPVDDPFDKEFSSSFLSEFPHSNPAEALDDPHKPIDHGHSNPSLPPPRFHHHNFDHFHFKGAGKNNACVPELHVKETDFRSSDKGCGIRTRGGGGGGEFREHSVKTVATSHCGSNQLITDAAAAAAAAAAADTSLVSSCGIGDHRGLSFSAATVAKDRDGKMSSQSDRVQTETIETAITSSSSGGSRNSFGRTSNQSRGTSACHKRKRIDAEDSDCSQSKDAELESAPRKKSALKSGSSRKSRAAQVHNLSERRRRDRINEKMRALQELLPHSNKTDKASMLHEAIEYMKSLQLQLQMMWMGSGMVPFMFPGVQQYMSRLGMGIGPLPLPHPHNPMHFPRLPLVDQALLTTPLNHQDAACQNPPIFNPGIINYHSQLQHPNIPEQYANYMQFRPLQTAASQQMNVFGFGPKTARHNQT